MSRLILFYCGILIILLVTACNSNTPPEQESTKLETPATSTVSSPTGDFTFSSPVEGPTFVSPLSTVEPTYTAIISLDTTIELSESSEVLIVTPSSPNEEIIISEVYNSDELEYVIIANNSSIPQDISGWYLYSPRKDKEFILPSSFVLPVGGTVKIYSGVDGQDNPPEEFYWTSEFLWSDDTDDVVLTNSVGRVIFWFTY